MNQNSDAKINKPQHFVLRDKIPCIKIFDKFVDDSRIKSHQKIPSIHTFEIYNENFRMNYNRIMSESLPQFKQNVCEILHNFDMKKKRKLFKTFAQFCCDK